MKRLNKISNLLIAAFLFAPLAMAQTTTSGIGYDKTVKQTGDKKYEITMTAFTTGQVVTTEITEARATDIVLVLDVSGSMAEQATTTTTTVTPKTEVSGNLSWNTTYLVEINGTEYYLRGFHPNNNNSRYSYRIKQGSEPTSYTDGQDFLTMAGTNGTGDYPNMQTSTWSGYNYITSSTISTSNYPSSYKFYTPETTSTSSTDIGVKLDLMKAAVKQFVQTVNDKNPSGDDKHRIGIVKFAGGSGSNFDMTGDTNDYNGTRQIQGLTSVTSGTQFDATINGLWAGGATNAGLALETAETMLTNQGMANHPKVVVFFTDGEPGLYGFHPTGQSNTATNRQQAQQTARRAVNAAYDLKSHPITVTENGEQKTLESKVYSVALLGSGAGQGDEAGRFLHYVSSNYKFEFASNSSYDFASDYSSAGDNLDPKWTGGATGGSEAPHGYYFLTGGDNLSDIFEQIANESSEASSTTQLKETSVVAVDVISQNFKLPDGADADDIKVFVAPFTGIAADDAINPQTNEPYTDEEKQRLLHYQFGTPVTAQSVEGTNEDPGNPYIPAYVPQVDGEGNPVIVNGEIQYTTTKIWPEASIDPNDDHKIRVTGFNYGGNPVCFAKVNNVEDPDRPRGYQLVIKVPIVVDPANEGGANVETNDEGSGIYLDGSTTPLVEFPKPTVVLPNIIVRKYGMSRYGESASFKLQRTDASGNVLTGTEAVEYNFIITHERDIHHRGFDFAQVKLQKEGYYKVTETTWAWNYTPSVSTKQLKGKTVSPVDNDADPEGGGVDAAQNYMVRHIGEDTEQTDEATGLTGAIFDFTNNLKNPTAPESLSNYNEASTVNIFNPKSTPENSSAK